MELNHKEFYLIGAFLAFGIPILIGVLCWWAIAALHILKIVEVSEPIIATVAMAGLTIGILQDCILLKKWIAKFYKMNSAVALLLYFVCSLLAVAFCIRVRGGNLVL